MAAKKTTKEKVSVELTVGLKTYKATGDTALEAISKLNPENTKVTGVLVIKKGSFSSEKILPRALIHRLYGQTNSTIKELARKQIASILPS